MTDYMRFLHDHLSDKTNGPVHGELTTDVADNIVNPDRLRLLTGGDQDNINGVIDAQLDRLIVASDGDIRLALFATASALGAALTCMHGPKRR